MRTFLVRLTLAGCLFTSGFLIVPSVAASGDPNSAASVNLLNGVAATANINANVRSGPGTTYAVIGYLPAGVSVPVSGRTEDSQWVFFTAGGLSGWVAASVCTITGDLGSTPVTGQSGGSAPPQPPAAPPPSGVTAIASTALNIRSGPGTNYGVIAFLPANVAVSVVGRTGDNNWINISYNSQQGWVAAWLCAISGDLNSVPVTGQSSSTPAAPPSGSANFGLGGQVPGYIAHPDLMHSAHMTWVKYQITWPGKVSPDSAGGLVNTGHAAGFKVLLSITGPLYPGGVDTAGYVNYISQVAQRGPDAIEVWNEENLNRQWPSGQVNPSSYVNSILAPAYNAIKAANPNVMVISGALAPTGASEAGNIVPDDAYLAGMRDAGAANYMDCLGVHYNAGATSPDVTYGHPADSGDHHYSWYYKPMYDLYTSMFPSRSLCFTELGYLSPDGFPYTPPNFWWAGGTTVTQQAAWLGRAVSMARSSGKVKLVIVFNVDFGNYGDDPQAGYAILRPDATCPACFRLAAAVP